MTISQSPFPTFELHADVETLLEPAVRAPLPLGLINDTVPVGHAGVDLLVLDRSLEESLAGLTRKDTVVEPGNFVSAHRAGRVDQLLSGDS